MEDEKYIIGQRIRRIRQSLTMSQREFADLLSPKLTAKSVSRWENGYEYPYKYLKKIAYIGNTTIESMRNPLDSVLLDFEKAKVLHAIAQPWLINDHFKDSNPKEYEVIEEFDNQAKEIMHL